jgi:hypothetical protein
MRAAQRRAAAEHQPQRRRVDRGDRRERLDDIEILFDERRTGQPEIRLDLEQRSANSRGRNTSSLGLRAMRV